VKVTGSDMAPIDTVVFDIGRVLVRLEFADFLQYLDAHGVPSGQIEELLEKIELAAYERGQFDGNELLRRIAAMGDGSMTVEALRELWLGMFVPDPQMIGFALRVAEARRVYLLSNIGDLHWEFLERETCITSIGHGALPSYKARSAKPDPAIYRKAEELFDLVPARTVFIDDLLPNVDTALQRGWRAIHHFDSDSTIERLRSMGVVA
jgi:FMN phosphatase YigB (HAD superfamily)